MGGLALLFDLDGTLVDSLPGIEYSCELALQLVAPECVLPSLREYLGPPIRRILAELLPDFDAERLDEVERYFRASYDSEGWQKSVAYDGVPETLRRLAGAGYRCFVITNKPQGPSRRILAHLQLMRHIEEVVSPDSKAPPYRSKAEGVRHLIHKFGLDAERAVLVGDSEDDALAAEMSGVRFAAVSYGYGCAHLSAKVPHAYALPDFASLLTVVTSFRHDLEGGVGGTTERVGQL